MSGKIVECHVKRIKGQNPVFTGTQVIIFSDPSNQETFVLFTFSMRT